MNVPEIVVDDETTATNPHSKRQSILGFFGKTKQRFRSPSPAARSGDVKIESLVNSFAWTDEIPTQKGLAEFKSKIKWVQKGQRVLNVEQKYDARIAMASPTPSRDASPIRSRNNSATSANPPVGSPPPLVLSRDRERANSAASRDLIVDPARDPRTDLRHDASTSPPSQVSLSRSPARHSRSEWGHVGEKHVRETGHVTAPLSPGNAAYMNRHSKRISKTPEAFDFEEFGGALESRESTRGGDVRKSVSRDDQLRQTVSRDSQLTAVDLSPYRQNQRELSPRQQSRDLHPTRSRDSAQNLTGSRVFTDYSATITSVTNLQQDGKLEQAHTLMGSVVTKSDLGWESQKNPDPSHVTPLLTLTLMYGLSLRHGWGGEKDEVRAFRYICSAAVGLCHVTLILLNDEESLESRDKKIQILHRSALKSALQSLAQSLYELGNCYHYGWGVTCSSAVAQIYYECGSWLGDEDAQEQRGRLLGESKKFEEKKLGANWLRVAQKKEGHSTAGESWVWKDKYDP